MSAVHFLATALVGLINALPVLGLLGVARLEAAYGVAVPSAELELLLRHRALLFGLVGGFVLVSLFLPPYRLAALIIAGISMLGFVLLALPLQPLPPAIARIVQADWVGLAALVVALATYRRTLPS